MPGTPTTKYALPTMAGTDFIADINEWTVSAMGAVDSKMAGYAEGTLAGRPTSTVGTPGVKGRIYRATDTGQWFLDTGTGWIDALGYTAYRTVAQNAFFVVNAITGPPTDYWLSPTGAPQLSGGASSAVAPSFVAVNAARWAVSGLTTKLRVGAAWATNTIAPNVTITFGLYPVSAVAGSAGLISVTLGTVSGSVARATPAASTTFTDASSDFSLPADGVYVLGIRVSGVPVNNSFTTGHMFLEVRHV